MDETLTVERLREVLRYAPDGRFFWITYMGSRAHMGDQAGSLGFNGYWSIGIDGVRYYEHRLAWLWCYGVLPEGGIDQIDGNKWNNLISNLRLATASQNLANSKLASTNTSGHKGVSWNKRLMKWSAQIMVAKRKIHLGFFVEIDDAAQAYRDAAQDQFGEFARVHEENSS